MIDLHSHILPGIDDGAVSVDDSIAMARQAEEDGIEIVCATPHIRFDHDVRIGELADRVRALNRELERAGVATRVVTGGEVAETIVDDLTDDELRAVSLGGAGTWILLEPAAGALDEWFVHTVDRLAARGHRAVVAHPERHFAGEETLVALASAVGAGALVQLTAAMLPDADPAGVPAQLARHGLLHVLASDSHSAEFGRPLRLSDGVRGLREIEVLRPHADWIVHEAPRAILAGEPATPPFAPR